MLATLFGGKLLNLLVLEWYISTVEWSIDTQNYTYEGDKIMNYYYIKVIGGREIGWAKGSTFGEACAKRGLDYRRCQCLKVTNA